MLVDVTVLVLGKVLGVAIHVLLQNSLLTERVYLQEGRVLEGIERASCNDNTFMEHSRLTLAAIP